MSIKYFVESEMYPAVGFDNESDRNEMALALYEEHIYFLTMRVMNWYHEPSVIRDGIEEDSMNNIRTWTFENFERPTQVAFWDSVNDKYTGGIAYGDEIICGCCGGMMEIAEVIEETPKGVKPIVVYKNWVGLHENIIGDDEADYEWEEEE